MELSVSFVAYLIH